MSSVTSSFRWLAGLSSIPNWVHVVVSIVILAIVGLLDIHQVRTASGNWSHLYFLVAIYAGFFLRGRTERAIYSFIIAMIISFPLLFSPSHVGLQKKGLGRILGVATKVRIPTDSKSTQLGPGDYVQLTVADTGEGMTEEVKSKVFEPFFTTKGVGKGTGLGMSVVHGIMKQCGGQITFESELNVGTTFTILLPAVLDSPAIEELVADAAFRGIETILLVEDEDEVRRIVRMGLEKEGYHVLEASDGEQAIQRAEGFSGKIDLLLTDVVMPNMGGAELAARVRQQRPGIRVLFMSGYTDDVVLKWGITNS